MPQVAGEDNDRFNAAAQAFTDSALEEQGVDLLQPILRNHTRAEIKRLLRALREQGECEVPLPYLRVNLPQLRAYRLLTDVFLRKTAVHDLNRAGVIVTRDWLHEWEVRERALAEGWSDAFEKGVLAHQGKTAFPGEQDQKRKGDYAAETSGQDTAGQYEKRSPHEGMYEVLYAFKKRAQKNGVPGIYLATLHNDVEVAAKDWDLIDYAHGRMPFVAFAREKLTSSLWDSRGIAELSMSQQNMLKLLNDTFCDHVQIATLPPYEDARAGTASALQVGPLARVRARRPGLVKFMDPPRYPRANEEYARSVRRDADEYFGRENPELSPAVAVRYMQDMVDDWLTDLTVAFQMMLQLCQQYMADEQVARITGMRGVVMPRSRREIQGQFDLTLHCDVESWNPEVRMKKAELISQFVLPADTEGIVPRDELVVWFIEQIDPVLAERWNRPVQMVRLEELNDEATKLAQMRAGHEPPFELEGVNHALRLRFIEETVKKNPQMIEDWPEASKAMLDQRVKMLAHQVQQQQNAMIGRTGAKPALG